MHVWPSMAFFYQGFSAALVSVDGHPLDDTDMDPILGFARLHEDLVPRLGARRYRDKAS